MRFLARQDLGFPVLDNFFAPSSVKKQKKKKKPPQQTNKTQQQQQPLCHLNLHLTYLPTNWKLHLMIKTWVRARKCQKQRAEQNIPERWAWGLSRGSFLVSGSFLWCLRGWKDGVSVSERGSAAQPARRLASTSVRNPPVAKTRCPVWLSNEKNRRPYSEAAC